MNLYADIESTRLIQWADMKHGTLTDFAIARLDVFRSNNLEQFQAFAQEYADLIESLTTIHEAQRGISDENMALRPRLAKLTTRAIGKYFAALEIWQTEHLTWAEREALVSTVFVWKP